MATIAHPQTAAFKTLVEEMYGSPSTAPDAPAPDAPAPLTDRALYRETVQSVADRAKAAMDPALHGRIDKAHVLVLAGDVELLEGGTAQVASQSSGGTQYFVVNGHCLCKDAPRALDGWCKHRLGAAIARRVQQALALAEERMVQDAPHPTYTPHGSDWCDDDAHDGASGCFVPLDTEGTPCQAVQAVCPGHLALPQAALPEAPASVNFHTLFHGRQVQFTLRDTNESRLVDRLEALMARFPVETPAPLITTTAATPPAAGWCAIHATAMKLNTKEGRTWYSHQTAAGAWCKGR